MSADCRLYVGDLSSVCTEVDLLREFSKFGNVTEVNVMRKGQASLCYGFVHMSTADEANCAAMMLNGIVLRGRKLKVRSALYGARDCYRKEHYSLHFKFSATELGVTTDEDALRNLFSYYGNVEDVSIRKKFFDRCSGLQKGYGFLKFENEESTNIVLATNSSFEFEGIYYTLESSTKVNRPQMKEYIAVPAFQRHQIPYSNVQYVKNDLHNDFGVYRNNPQCVFQPSQHGVVHAVSMSNIPKCNVRSDKSDLTLEMLLNSGGSDYCHYNVSDFTDSPADLSDPYRVSDLSSNSSGEPVYMKYS